MMLQSVSAPQQREFKTNDGNVRTIKYRILRFTDGVDSILGETSERLTNKIDATADNVRLKLIEGHVYTVDYTLRVQDYTNKQGQKDAFFSVIINNAFNLV